MLNNLKPYLLMTNNFDDLKKITELIRSTGWEVDDDMVPIPHFPCGVPAGKPFDICELEKKWVLIPRSLLGNHPIFSLVVKGDSMIGADMMDGDEVYVEVTEDYSSGDIVVAYLDGETTIKHLCKKGDQMWLMPANNAYKPIDMSKYVESWIMGKVENGRRQYARASTMALLNKLEEELKKMEAPVMSLEDKAREAVAAVLNDLKKRKRLWYCVYRALIDATLIDKGDYEGFKALVDKWFPGNDFKINLRDISKLAVLSFDKPIAEWVEEKAPVGHTVFFIYYKVATSVIMAIDPLWVYRKKGSTKTGAKLAQNWNKTGT